MQALKPALQSSKGRSGRGRVRASSTPLPRFRKATRPSSTPIQATHGTVEFSRHRRLAGSRRAPHGDGALRVIGTGLYSIDSSGTETLIGTIPGINPVALPTTGPSWHP
jgi:hypothetical protein